MNGGSVLAMKGKDCYAIACDLRFGFQFQTISTNFEKIFKMGEGMYIGLGGLATDVLSMLVLDNFLFILILLIIVY